MNPMAPIHRMFARRRARREFVGVALAMAARLIDADGKCPVSFARKLRQIGRKAGLR